MSANIITCAELNDIWISEIGPKMRLRTIVALSMVNKWGWLVAHSIHPTTSDINHQLQRKYIEIRSVSVCEQACVDWPHLKFKLRLIQQNQDTNLVDLKNCRVASLELKKCGKTKFENINARELEAFSFSTPKLMINESSCVSLEQALMCCSNLLLLELEECISELVSIDWLARALTHLTRVTSLSLKGNSLDDTKIAKVCEGLRQTTHITKLDLSNNTFGQEGASHVGEAIANANHITAIDLQFNHIGSDGVRGVINALSMSRALQNITYLNFGGTHMGKEGAEHVAEALKIMNHVTWLSLSTNQIGTSGVQHIVQILADKSSLTYLDIAANGLDSGTADQIKRTLSHVKTIKLNYFQFNWVME
eukprot:c7755_g2_i1.p1 GENE.c7755_g2_i1~~c7755_g2_i1.p1  ORF type:complete len:365 (-),score=84.34 c7755_g2_i1:99-1193(-)